MRKEIKKNKKVRMLGKVIVVIIAASASLWLLIQLFSWADRHDQNELMKQKACWKAIYTILEKSPKEKAAWIKETISIRRGLGGGLDYCSALEFIKNGQNHDEGRGESK